MFSNQEILCFHYYYPPIRSGGVIRNYYFSKEFAKLFKHVHIITTSNVDVMDQEYMPIPDNISIYKANTKDFRSIKKSGNHISMNAKESKIYKILSKIKKTLPFHFYLDEGGQKYIKNSIRIADQIISEHLITHLYSSFMPYTDHFIASKVKKKHNDLHWIADFRDLQIEPIYKNIYFSKWNRQQEIRILKGATKVTTISQGLVKSMIGLHKNIQSIPRGIELNKQPKVPNTIFKLAYTGSLFFQFRDGKFFVEALTQLITIHKLNPSQIQFVYAGRESIKWQNWFSECQILEFLDDKGFVSRDESKEIQLQANALVLLTSSTVDHQGVFTGKLFEYLETMNPIINILNGVHDEEFEDLFKTLEAGKIFYPSDKKVLISYLEKLYSNFVENQVFNISDSALKCREAMSWEARAKELLDVK